MHILIYYLLMYVYFSKKKKEEAAERVLVGTPNEAEEEAGPVEAALEAAEAAEEKICGAAIQLLEIYIIIFKNIKNKNK